MNIIYGLTCELLETGEFRVTYAGKFHDEQDVKVKLVSNHSCAILTTVEWYGETVIVVENMPFLQWRIREAIVTDFLNEKYQTKIYPERLTR